MTFDIRPQTGRPPDVASSWRPPQHQKSAPAMPQSAQFDPAMTQCVVRSFAHFAKRTAEADATIYAVLSSCIAGGTMHDLASSNRADVDFLRQICLAAQPGNPPPNLLFGAVHELLLHPQSDPSPEQVDARRELVRFYPTMHAFGDDAAPRIETSDLLASTAHAATRRQDLFEAFVRFARLHESEIGQRVRARRVQTNEIGRCPALLAGFSWIAEQAGRDRPLDLLEIGSSAGLNLLFDQYAYEFSDGCRLHPTAHPDRFTATPPVLRTEVRLSDTNRPTPPRMDIGYPVIGQRLGIDLNPIDVHDEASMRWLEGLVWPEHVDRLRSLRAAVEMARREPPTLIRGDATRCLPQVIEERFPPLLEPQTPLLCIFHSYVTYQMSRDDRANMVQTIEQLGQRRDLAHLSLEWVSSGHFPRLTARVWIGRRRTDVTLAERCHHHGRWIEWNGAANEATTPGC